jgi:hypothetical protein
MSSSTRSRREPGAARSAASVLAVLAVLWLAVPGAAPAFGAPGVPTTVPLPDVTVLPVTDGQAWLVVDIDTGTRPVLPDAVAVSVAGVRQPTTLVPVRSDQLAAALVVDASQAGGAALGSWLSGAARFVLEQPALARTAVVADATPPAVLSELRQGPVDLVRGLGGVHPHGERHTSQALTLAVHQLPPALAGPRVVVLYTGAADAGGEASTALATRLAGAHILLVVVTTATDTRYWSDATRPTGGFLAPAVASGTAAAFDQVATTLRDRYLISFPAPAHLPARASVRVNLQDVTLAADVVVPATTGDTRPGRGAGATWVTVALWAAAVAGVLVLLIGLLVRPR